MSEEALVSPLLNGFVLGSPMAERPGVSCHPAMKENSDQKYIVKILSMPASQVQLDALLITGAYSDPAAALDYFRQQADDTAAEAAFLKSLSKLEGFVSYEDWQVAPMKTNRLGYQVFLLGKYGRTLEKAIRRNTITHLQAVNLALDVCAALALCRRAGYLYIDLKPSNIMVENGKHFKIADLGFVSTQFLSYSSMPERFISAYTAPEVKDPMSSLNETVDTYALGMILYRLFNNGQLPVLPADPSKPLPAPAMADEAMAQLILKACAPKPEDRWASPTEFGQAVVAYMQTNSVNDTPLSQQAPVVQEPVPEPVRETVPEEKVPVSAVVAPPVSEPLVSEPPVPGISASYETAAPDSTVRLDMPLSSSGTGAYDAALFQSTQRFSPGAVAVEPEPIPDPLPTEDADILFPVVSAQTQEPGFDLDSELSEVNSILKPAAPKYPTMPPRPVRKPVMDNIQPVDITKNKRSKAPLVLLILLVLGGILGGFGYWFYHNFYLQPVESLSIEGTQNEMVVTVVTPVGDNLLTIHCTDVYGNSKSSPVVKGQATFTDLTPNSLYNVLVTADSLHKLTGQVSGVFTTEGQTEIVSLSAVSGQEDGYVMLNLTVSGHEPSEWVVSATCEGEDNIIQNFSGHTVTLKGLTVGKEYSFRLTTADGSNLGGQTTTKFKVVSLVTASNLEVISRLGGDLTVGWDPPAHTEVGSWTVRCYAEGYDETQSVSGTIATFKNTTNDKSYTIEVTPAGMTEPTRLTISANPVTIASFDIEESDSGSLDVSWVFEGKAPEAGWLLQYALNDSESSTVIKCSESKASITPRLPDTTYHLTVQANDDTSIFNNTHSYTTKAAGSFSTQGLSADKIKSRLLKTPSGAKWLVDDLTEEAYTTAFNPGDRISMALEATVKFYVNHEDIHVMYVYRDSSGEPIPALVSEETIDWYDLFYDGKYQLGELNLPKAPTEAGNYSVIVYFNGAPVATNSFTIS